jgi:hypothetical protein
MRATTKASFSCPTIQLRRCEPGKDYDHMAHVLSAFVAPSESAAFYALGNECTSLAAAW